MHDENIHTRFERLATATPDAIAVVHEDEVLSYRELDDAANTIADALERAGIGPGNRVALHLDRTVHAIAAILGVLKAGASYVPIDPDYPAERVAFMGRDSGCRVALTDGRATGADFEAIDVAMLSKGGAQTATRREAPSSSEAYVIYTSGSTGFPKGVAVEHRSVVSYIAAFGEKLAIGAGDRLLQSSTLSFDLSVEEIFGALLNGAALVLRTGPMFTDIASFVRRCEVLGITILDLPTGYWRELVLGLEAGTAFPKTVRTVVIGGEKADRETLKLWHRHAPSHVPLLNTYGPTETTVVATWAVLSEGDDGADPPIGVPVPNVCVYVVGEDDELVAPGTTGELLIGGIGVARGYLNRPDQTARAFIPNPFGDGRVYRTGDRVRQRPDGALEFVGRDDEQVKVRGFRVELGEVTTALREIAEVRDAVVLVRDGRLTAWVVSNLDERALARLARRRLPEAMVPLAFVRLDAIPRMVNGKVDFGALPSPTANVARVPSYAPPRTLLEKRLCDLLAELLTTNSIGIHDSFFDLGVDSLLATRFTSLARGRYGVELTTRSLFDSPTVAELASHASIGARSETIPRLPRRPVGASKS